MIKLMFGDCKELMRKIEPGSVDLIATDLPYGTTRCKWDTIIPFDILWKGVKWMLKPDGIFVTTSSQPFTSFLVTSNPKWHRESLIWNKVRPSGHLNAKKMHMRYHEDVIVFSGKKGVYNPKMIESDPKNWRKTGLVKNSDVWNKYESRQTEKTGLKYPGSIICFPKVNSKHVVHPSQKPLELYSYIVETYSNHGDTVADICMGSGTTGEACVNTGRSFIGIEDNQKYFDIASKRIHDAVPVPRYHDESVSVR